MSLPIRSVRSRPQELPQTPSVQGPRPGSPAPTPQRPSQARNPSTQPPVTVEPPRSGPQQRMQDLVRAGTPGGVFGPMLARQRQAGLPVLQRALDSIPAPGDPGVPLSANAIVPRVMAEARDRTAERVRNVMLSGYAGMAGGPAAEVLTSTALGAAHGPDGAVEGLEEGMGTAGLAHGAEWVVGHAGGPAVTAMAMVAVGTVGSMQAGDEANAQLCEADRQHNQAIDARDQSAALARRDFAAINWAEVRTGELPSALNAQRLATDYRYRETINFLLDNAQREANTPTVR